MAAEVDLRNVRACRACDREVAILEDRDRSGAEAGGLVTKLETRIATHRRALFVEIGVIDFRNNEEVFGAGRSVPNGDKNFVRVQASAVRVIAGEGEPCCGRGGDLAFVALLGGGRHADRNLFCGEGGVLVEGHGVVAVDTNLILIREGSSAFFERNADEVGGNGRPSIACGQEGHGIGATREGDVACIDRDARRDQCGIRCATDRDPALPEAACVDIDATRIRCNDREQAILDSVLIDACDQVVAPVGEDGALCRVKDALYGDGLSCAGADREIPAARSDRRVVLDLYPPALVY